MKLNYSQNEMVNLGLGIADGSMDEKDIKQWIKKHIV
jgi:death-on-curing protein